MLDLSSAKFEGEAPSLALIVGKAQSMCEVRIVMGDDSVKFVGAAPREEVGVRVRGDSVDLWHMAGDTPALMLLIKHALIALGGDFGYVPSPLPSPLTGEQIRRLKRSERISANVASTVILLSLISLILIGVALIVLLAHHIYLLVS